MKRLLTILILTSLSLCACSSNPKHEIHLEVYNSSDNHVYYTNENEIVSSVSESTLKSYVKQPVIKYMSISGNWSMEKVCPHAYKSSVTSSLHYLNHMIDDKGYKIDVIEETPYLLTLELYNDSKRYKIYITQDRFRWYKM